MMRRTSLSSWILLMIGTTACTQVVYRDPDDKDSLGSLSLALGTTRSNGEVYRLRNAELVIMGPETVAVDGNEHLAENSIELELQAGTYNLTLLPGWTLQRQSGADWVPVRAFYANPQPDTFVITAGNATNKFLNFLSDGTVISVGPETGAVVLGVGIGFPPPDALTCAQPCNPGYVCAPGPLGVNDMACRPEAEVNQSVFFEEP